MIIPFYHKAESVVTFPKEVLGKWTCIYHEEKDGIKFSRYLHPDGWKLYSYWWSDVGEMTRTFNRIGQMDLPVSNDEFTDELELLSEWKKQFYQTSLDELEKKVGLL